MLNEKQTRPSAAGDGRSTHSFELDDSVPQTGRRQYEGPFQGAVYSPLPLLDSEKLIGESEALYRLFDLIGAASQSDQNVLIQGEVGTGKNLVARTIHSQSDRSENWLIVVNCALVSAGELKSVLLGPSGYSSEGLVEAALGGTIVFDRVDQLDASAQACLNHLLETHTFTGAPGSRSTAFDLQLLFLATQPLPDEDFKESLHYRVNQFSIQVPPLRTRTEDIPQLAHHFLQEETPRKQSDVDRTLSKGAKTALRRHDWPGNVRELQNAVRRAAAVSDTSTIGEDDLPPSVREAKSSASQEEARSTPRAEQESVEEGAREEEASDETSSKKSSPFFSDIDGSIPEIEEIKREAVKRAYNLCDGNIDRAAVELGIARSTMYRLLKRYDLK